MVTFAMFNAVLMSGRLYAAFVDSRSDRTR
jgi:hypothetical protein